LGVLTLAKLNFGLFETAEIGVHSKYLVLVSFPFDPFHFQLIITGNEIPVKCNLIDVKCKIIIKYSEPEPEPEQKP
jgi:hypothetical protein